MSTERAIKEVYLQDKRKPYYSLQGCKPQIHEYRNIESAAKHAWQWGHFRSALRSALERCPLKFKRAPFNSYRACRQMERLFPGIRL